MAKTLYATLVGIDVPYAERLASRDRQGGDDKSPSAIG
jgi:hypothetical protein